MLSYEPENEWIDEAEKIIERDLLPAEAKRNPDLYDEKKESDAAVDEHISKRRR